MSQIKEICNEYGWKDIIEDPCDLERNKIYELALSSEKEKQELINIFNSEKNEFHKIFIAKILSDLKWTGIVHFILDVFEYSKDIYNRYSAAVLLVVCNHPTGRKAFTEIALHSENFPSHWIVSSMLDIGTPYALSVLDDIAAIHPEVKKSLELEKNSKPEEQSQVEKLYELFTIYGEYEDDPFIKTIKNEIYSLAASSEKDKQNLVALFQNQMVNDHKDELHKLYLAQILAQLQWTDAITYALTILERSTNQTSRYRAALALVLANHPSGRNTFKEIIFHLHDFSPTTIVTDLVEVGTPYALSILDEIAKSSNPIKEAFEKLKKV